VINSICANLRFKVDKEFFDIFDDIDKVVLLNKLCRPREREKKSRDFLDSADDYKFYIVRFYFCQRFNKIYQNWIDSGKKQFLKPSVDHIHPFSKNGSHDLKNLNILTILQNRAKGAMDNEDWLEVVADPEKYFY
jgi:5-methylcytosine-specific restriction endonuclease McrA